MWLWYLEFANLKKNEITEENDKQTGSQRKCKGNRKKDGEGTWTVHSKQWRHLTQKFSTSKAELSIFRMSAFSLSFFLHFLFLLYFMYTCTSSVRRGLIRSYRPPPNLNLRGCWKRNWEDVAAATAWEAIAKLTEAVAALGQTSTTPSAVQSGRRCVIHSCGVIVINDWMCNKPLSNFLPSPF